MRNSGKMNHVTLTPALSLILFDAEGLSADLVPCFVARDTNVGSYAVPSLPRALTAALAKRVPVGSFTPERV
jgi:hypothetical protein